MGLTVVDAGIIFGVLDADDAHHPAALRALSDLIGNDDEIAVPASAYAEALVGPAKRGPSGRRAVDDFLADLTAAVEPITRQVAARAAELRASHGKRLKLPDALVVAIAMHLNADRILTTDRRWPSCRWTSSSRGDSSIADAEGTGGVGCSCGNPIFLTAIPTMASVTAQHR